MNGLAHHSQNTQRIIAYLSYLRDISRKIISRNGFEKCLLNKSLGYAVQFEDLELEIKSSDDYYNELNNYYGFLQKNHDKKLFIGFGTVIGTRKRIFAAPILTIQCEVSKDETTHIIYVEPVKRISQEVLAQVTPILSLLSSALLIYGVFIKK